MKIILDVNKPDLDIQDKAQSELKLRKIKKIRKQLIKDIIDPSNGEPKRKPREQKYIHDKDCPYRASNGLVLESHYVWWKNHPEDPIEYNEVIHHINQDPTDNRIENLSKLKAKDHRKLHGKIIKKENWEKMPISKKWGRIG